MARSRLAQLRIKKHWSQQHAATLLGVDVMTLSRWEGSKTIPHGYNLDKLCKVYGCTEEELGLQGEVGTAMSTSPPMPLITKFADSDLTVRLVSRAFAARSSRYSEIQANISALLEEIDMDSITRREALQRLIALSLGTLTFAPVPNDVLHQCAVSLVACQELGKGQRQADLALAFEGASTALQQLRPLIHLSQHRKTAATLAAQAARLQQVLAGHLEGPEASVLYAKQAVLYGKESGIEEYLMALEALTWSYESVPRYAKQALETIEQAASLLRGHQKQIPGYIHSQIYGALAVMQARNGSESNTALRSAAKLAFADREYGMLVNDPVYSLVVNEAESLYHQGSQAEALSSLSQLVDNETLRPKRTLSERGYLRVLRDMTLVSLKGKEKDLERSARLWQTTMQKATALKSERRFDEAVSTYQIIDALWGDDPRIQDLRPLTMHW